MKAYLKKRIASQNKGVVMRGGKYIARMYVDNRFFLVGTYDTSEEASLAYKRAVANERVRLSRNNADNKNPKDVTTPETATYKMPTAKAAARCKKRIRRSYIGVIERGNKFVAQIRRRFANETKEFGTYDTPEEAAHAFDRVVIERKLPTSLLNYPACKTAKKKALTVSSSDKAVAALSALAIVTQQSKPKKKTKTANKANGRPRNKNVNDSTDDEKRLSFAEWYKECVMVDNQRSGQPRFKRPVYQHYQQWCIQRNKPWMSIASIKGYKPKKKTKKTATGQSSHSFPFGIPAPLVKSFNDFFEETCRVDFTNSKPSDSGLLMVGDVHKEYRAWCTRNKRPYCPERTSKEWERAPFVVNNRRIDRLPPFRLLMFAKLDRLPRRVKDVFSSTETAWRRHKKSYVGHPYYQGLQWKDSFTPTLKYVHGKKRDF